MTGSVDYTGTENITSRNLNPALEPNLDVPDDTRLWAALQDVSGGSWGGCVYDVDAIISKLKNS
jgi:hypothetical protein